MRPKIVVIIAASLAHFVQAQVPDEPSDLIALRDAWEKARAAALAPVDKKYDDALTVMRERYTKQGNLAAALAVDAAQKKLKGSPGDMAAQQSTATSSSATTQTSKQRRLSKDLIGTTWTCDAWKASMTLNEDGTTTYSGTKGPIAKWQVTEDGKLALSQGNDFRTGELGKDGDTFRIFFGSQLVWNRQKSKK
ncbi:MAG: hypothetical protein JNJ83_05080 [Verrucomicrobiaceae bacterium]|nr:hypothetical protein [Verrucomicrobiaceae bacterium]